MEALVANCYEKRGAKARYKLQWEKQSHSQSIASITKTILQACPIQSIYRQDFMRSIDSNR
ncbi:hypothetical protein BLOT_004835 [Blomia tropicalis]|nr:hypothetical protein BLOT_004835 [Blomia tropicalis]